MNLVPKKLATGMLRMDHTHVMTTFHQYHADASPKTRRALVETICLALEVHARLEEEIVYPAMREVAESDRQAVDQSLAEHAEMKRLIGVLRGMDPGGAEYDPTLYELMRGVMHHVADEETRLLPDAERLLGAERLSELGARMTKRRIELVAPRSGEMAANMARAMPAGRMLVATGAVLAGTYLARRAFTARPPH